MEAVDCSSPVDFSEMCRKSPASGAAAGATDDLNPMARLALNSELGNSVPVQFQGIWRQFVSPGLCVSASA